MKVAVVYNLALRGTMYLGSAVPTLPTHLRISDLMSYSISVLFVKMAGRRLVVSIKLNRRAKFRDRGYRCQIKVAKMLTAYPIARDVGYMKQGLFYMTFKSLQANHNQERWEIR